jgi:hypothetical protein
VADLDYVFLADYARVDPAGTLTAIGASYTIVTAQALPTTHLLSVAGRVRSTLGAPPVNLEVKLNAPDGRYSIALSAELAEGPSPRPYAGNRLGHLFAITTGVPLVAEGLYEVEIHLDGEQVRLLKFEVTLPQA